MNLHCLFGRHRPMLTSIVKRTEGYSAICDGCGLTLERGEEGRWRVPEGLAQRRDLSA